MIENKLNDDIIEKIFERQEDGTLKINESFFVEYKENFQIGANIFIAMNGLANNKGGYIVCGVNDETHEPVGLNEKSLEKYKEIDSERFRGKLYTLCQPNINYQHRLIEKLSKKFIVIYVENSENKPHIFLSQHEGIIQGDIYYRYNDSCKKIQYAELEQIIEYKRLKEQEKWMSFLEKIARVGVDNVIMVDTKEGRVISPENNIVSIDSSIVEKMNYIREGKFVDSGGVPTIKLVATFVEEPSDFKKAILAKDIYLDFLSQNESIRAREYLNQICEIPGKYPIFYYIKLAKFKNQAEVIDFINGIETSKAGTKNKLIERIKGKKLEKCVTTEPEGAFDPITDAIKSNRKLKKAILSNSLDSYVTEKDYEIMCKAIKTLNKEEILRIKNPLLEKLRKLVEIHFLGDDIKMVPPHIKNAVWYIDQTLFFDALYN